MITLKKIPDVSLDKDLLTAISANVPAMPLPLFATTETDISRLETSLQEFRRYPDIILIGNGGSRTSAYAFYHALTDERHGARLHFLSSAEPEQIARLRRELDAENTLVLVISKSGDNINAIEPLLSFLDYPVLVVTQDRPSTLREMAQRKNWTVIEHPDVGGRFSGLTSCGLVPAILAGIDARELHAGGRIGYQAFAPTQPIETNVALQTAATLATLEQEGYTEIFASIYSSALFAFLPLGIQLIHESTGKSGLGQTIFGDIAPESQHHTNQRFFGGRRNVIGFFFSLDTHEPDPIISTPETLSDIPFREHPLGVLDGLSGSQTLRFDKAGVVSHCAALGIPAFDIEVDYLSARSAGEFMAFWHYLAVYSAVLRGQNPYDQPEVEYSKTISFRLRAEKS